MRGPSGSHRIRQQQKDVNMRHEAELRRLETGDASVVEADVGLAGAAESGDEELRMPEQARARSVVLQYHRSRHCGSKGPSRC